MNLNLNKKTWFEIKFLVPLIVVIIFVIQFLLANVSTLSPWKGGGFGMFSSISERMIKGVGITIDGDTLDLSINIKNTNCSKNLPVDFIDKLILYPKNKDLKKLAECLSCERFVKINAQHPKKLNYTKYALSKKYINTEDYIVFKEIILEVRELVYKRETNKVYSKKINSTVKALCD